MPSKEDLISHFVNHPFKYFQVGKCDVCAVGDVSYFVNGGGNFRIGSTCRCPGKNHAADWSALDYYLNPANGWEAAITAYLEESV